MPSNKDIDDLADQIGKKLTVKEENIETLAHMIESGKAKKILVLTGAGVSVAAGIPDFRTPGTGLYSNLKKYNLPYPEAVFDVGFYRRNPQPFVTLAHELWPGLQHSPTKTHSFLSLLSKRGLLLRNYSQNIDGLEFLAGIPPDELVECHGHFRTASCIDCGKAADAEMVKDEIVKKANVPICKYCKGNVKPDIVFFGEDLPDRFHKLLKKDVKEADLLIVMGTSLQVMPVSLIPEMVYCRRVVFNREKVMKKSRKQDLFIQGDCDTNVEKLCSLLGWEEDLVSHHEKAKINPKTERTSQE